MQKWVVEDPKEKYVWWPSEEMKRRAWVSDPSIYERAAKDPVAFWGKLAAEGLEWFKKWDTTYVENPPYFKWFVGGKLNICYNAVDRHLKAGKGDKVAIIWVPEPIEESPRKITYKELHDQVNRFANVLKSLGVKRGDRVGIYLPLIPEVQIAMLACARIGAVHSVVFSAFSSDSLRVRLEDAGAKVLVTADGYYRRGKLVDLKASADEGVKGTSVEKVVVVKRAGNEVNMVEGRDRWWHELMEKAEPSCEPEVMDAEDMLYLLYTSGTTGRPKGVIHTTGGYATQVYWTTKWVFDLHDDDLFWCTSDIGWVTGHSYACYGPLLNGISMLIYEGSPDYPTPDRWWEIIEQHKVTVFYTAPTAIRMFVGLGEALPKKHNLSSLRLLGTVGEPIDMEAWLWYFNNIGGGRCPITDTWWQTETGGTLIMSLPGVGPFMPTVAGRSFPGTRHEVMDEDGSPTPVGYLVQLSPFGPGMLRGLYKADDKYRETYWSRYRNQFYFTGDGARRASHGCIRVTGRVDDVMKVAGHRLSTAELEDAMNRHAAVSESAVIPKPHPIKGETPVAYVILKKGVAPSDELAKELVAHIGKVVGPIAKPEQVFIVEELPKTRSGKIMRRILKALLTNDPIGDTSTLFNPESVESLKKKVGYTGPG
ncbi:MAG: acetate--CoA ligase [Candidatus Hodarchaeaceae archaeon]|nr:acetate--CoA ligase [Candidatus Hodarchaeaceae archaeon]